MSNFIPGHIVSTFTTRTGEKATIRYPKWEDLEDMTSFINQISQEDTFITFSGETITKEEESDFLLSLFKGMEMGNKVQLFCFVNGRFAGSCSVERNEHAKKRSWHVAVFGIVLAKDFRGEGIGEALATAIIEEAKKKISGLKLITLCVYGINDRAQALYKKLGFQEWGRMPKGVLYRDAYVDEVEMFLEI